MTDLLNTVSDSLPPSNDLRWAEKYDDSAERAALAILDTLEAQRAS
jgi:hypothetical protein